MLFFIAVNVIPAFLLILKVKSGEIVCHAPSLWHFVLLMQSSFMR